ncbi:MAG: hypothetical protein KAW40_01915 [Candidatus Aenigmarchaeota archaeon]|nr:hypothetical protein [Candidatus Aenigmarchaeota archaeon]
MVPGMAEVKKASACPDNVVCVIPPSGSHGFPQQADIRRVCTYDCDYCCEYWCWNVADAEFAVGSNQCYCTVAGQHSKCGSEPQP